MNKSNPAGFRIAVVGHLVRDRIIAPSRKPMDALGGIAYNIAALEAIMKEGKIFPVCRVGNDIKEWFIGVFGHSKLFDDSSVSYHYLPNLYHLLTYRNDGTRDEWNSREVSPISTSSIPAKCDAVLINFISGNDVSLSDFKQFANRFKGLIYCDFHSLSLGYKSDGTRYLRRHPRWRDYVSCADIIQMNIMELESISGIYLKDKAQIIKASDALLEAGAKIAIITLGGEGVIISQSSPGQANFIPPIKISNQVDPTGCGDTFAAAFVYHYLQTHDAIKSAEISNLYAAAKATFSGINGFSNLHRIIKTLKPTKAISI